MTDQDQTKLFRPSVHVEVYFWISWLVAAVGLPLLLSLLSFVYGNVDNALLMASIFLALFLFLDQLAHRRCSSENLKASRFG